MKKSYLDHVMKKIIVGLLLIFFSLGAAACSNSKEEATNTEVPLQTEEKSLLEQAVDWANVNIFDEIRDKDVFTLESKTYHGKEFNFLFLQEENIWECELYYIECDEEENVTKVTFCGSGNKDLFTYKFVTLNKEAYVAVYAASHMGEGDLILSPLEDANGVTYTIENVIDRHYELMALVDENGYNYTKSQVYHEDKLEAKYYDVNRDGYTDIVLSGMILEYISYDNESGELELSQNLERTYLYNEASKRFDFSEEILSPSQQEDPNLYTGYLDLNPRFSEGNPVSDYDGDGLSDRIYKEFDTDKQTSSFYLHFGNDTKLLLSDYSWGIFYKTETADLTGDGVEEILFFQESMSTKAVNLYLSIYALKDGKYEAMDVPYYRKDELRDEVDGRLHLPLIMSKVDAARVSIYQPDADYQGYITTQSFTYENGDTLYEMDTLYHQEIEGEVVDYPANDMNIVDAGENGRKALMLRSYLGDKWCSKSVLWKLEFLNDEWKITNIYQTDPIRVELGTEFSADLNGDKVVDTVYYGIEKIEEHGFGYEVPFLRLNDTDYDYKYLEERFGVYIGNCSKIGYYILDIDISDPYREIAILDEGPSDDPVTHFFRYTDEELQYCGFVTDFPDNFHPQGDGAITAKKRLSILQTWWADATWKLNDNNVLEEQPSEIYYPYQYYSSDGSTTNYTKNDLSLFQKPDQSSEAVIIKKGEAFHLTATDDLNWIEITSESGAKGWFFLHDGYEVALPTGECKVGDIVTYLNMAD